MDALKQLLTTLGPKRLAAMGVVALLVLGLTTALAVRGSGGGGPMGYLFTDLDPAAAKTMSDRLNQLGVKWTLSPDGSAIMVPADRVAQLRMDLAGEQIAGKVGYEVIDAESPFGVSDARAKLNQTRAIEGELARSIETLERVERARVHLVMPERPLFAAEARPATAAVTLRTTGRLPQSAVDAIRALVAASVPDLSPDRISIVDQRGTLLASAGDGGGSASSLDERQASLEARLRAQVESLIERAVGAGRVRVEVAADLARAARRDETERFDPDGQVVARQTTVESAGEDNQGSTASAASVATQLPERQQPGQAVTSPTDQRRSTNREISEETAYNSSRTRSTVVEEAGKLNRLTVSVMVDPKTASGRTLTKPELDRMKSLVETAVGFDAARGDKVVVEAIPLVQPLDAEDDATGSGIGVGTWINIGLAVLLGASIIGGALLIRSGRRALAEQPPMPTVNDSLALEAGAEAGASPVAALPAGQQQAALPSNTEHHHSTAVTGVTGEVRTSIIHNVGASVAANPSEATALIRQMMSA